MTFYSNHEDFNELQLYNKVQIALTGDRFAISWDSREGKAVVAIIDHIITGVNEIASGHARPNVSQHSQDVPWRPKQIIMHQNSQAEPTIINWPHKLWGTDDALEGLSVMLKSPLISA